MKIFYKIGVLENFQKFTGKHLSESLFNKVAGLKRLHPKCFSTMFVKPLRTPSNKTPYTIKIAYGQSKSTISFTGQNNNIKVRYSYRRAVWALLEDWPTWCSLPIFSANLVVIPLLRTLKNSQAKKKFLITLQNEATLQRKQISKLT